MTATNETAQTPSANAALTFDNDQTKTGTAIHHTPDTGMFLLMENGFYEIHYNTVGTNAAAARPPVSVGVHLTNGGIMIPGTMTISSINSCDAAGALAGTTIVDVTSAPAAICLAANNGNGSFSHTSLAISKIG